VPSAISYNTSKPVRQFITSGSAEEQVPDQSLFREYFVKAITTGDADANQDGYLTGSEMGSYLFDKVTNYSYNQQHPQAGKIRDQHLDKGDFVFVLNSQQVEPNQPREVVITNPEAVIRYGSIELTTEISGKLYLDGRYIMQVTKDTRMTLNDVSTGNHTLRIEGADTWQETVTVTENLTLQTTAKNNRHDAKGFDREPEMVFIKGGNFKMGSDDNNFDGPVHEVKLSDFYFGKYEVTVAQFQQFIEETGYLTDADKDNGSDIWTGSKSEKKNRVNWKCDVQGNTRPQSEYNHPVIHVSWNDAVAYCNWISRKTGKAFRLPTEAEWEYAAGNGPKHTKYSWGNGNPYGKNGGNVADQSLKQVISDRIIFNGYNDGFVYTAPVGSFNANDFGLYDMTGNVWEWCSDWMDFQYYDNSPGNNPQGPSKTEDYRVIRGGA